MKGCQTDAFKGVFYAVVFAFARCSDVHLWGMTRCFLLELNFSRSKQDGCVLFGEVSTGSMFVYLKAAVRLNLQINALKAANTLEKNRSCLITIRQRKFKRSAEAPGERLRYKICVHKLRGKGPLLNNVLLQ